MNVIKDLKISEEDYGYSRKRTDHDDYVYATRVQDLFVILSIYIPLPSSIIFLISFAISKFLSSTLVYL